MAQIHISSLMNQYQKDNAAESNFTELYGAIGGSYQPLNSILTSISGLATNVTGLIKLTNGAASLDTSSYALASAIPTSINGLSGGSLTTPLVIKGGDGGSVAKIALDHTQSGQITDESTHTLFGFTTNGTTTLTIGHSNYAMALRGSATRPTYNGSNLALYSDIPSVPTVNNGTLTIQKNGSTVQTFMANQSGNATANITVPTKTSDLNNDSGFITSSAINDGTLTIQKNGTSVGTFTANQSGNTTANVVVNNGTATFQQNGQQITTFTADQSSNTTVNILTYNPNLLINPNFAINQRGSSSYTGNNKYGVDCWINGGSTTQTPQSDLRLKVVTTGTWSGVCQFLESYTALKGQVITFTVWGTFPSTGVRIAIKSLTGTTQTDLATADGTNANSFVSVSYTVPTNASYTYLFVAIYNKAAATSYLKYAKLEIGNKYSNYALPNPAEELLKCCRYYWVVNPGSGQWRRFAVGYSVSATESRYIIPFPAPMRVEPYITLTGTLRDNASWAILSKGGDTNATTYALHLQCTGSGMSTYRPSTICTGDAAGNIICDSGIYFS